MIGTDATGRAPAGPAPVGGGCAPETSALRGRPPAKAFGKLLLTETKLAWRQPLGLILGLALPVLLLVIFWRVPKFREPSAEMGGLTPLTVYVPILSVFVVAMVALVGLCGPLAFYREMGVLRRISTTPAPPSWVLGAQLLVNLAIVAAALVIISVGARAFGAPAPKQVGGYVLAMILATAALIAIGLWIAAVARTGQAANIFGQLLFYPLMFFAGLYFPRELMPSILRHISDWTPLGAGVQALQGSMEGSFPAAQPLLVMAGYAAVFLFFAVRNFKWE